MLLECINSVLLKNKLLDRYLENILYKFWKPIFSRMPASGFRIITSKENCSLDNCFRYNSPLDDSPRYLPTGQLPRGKLPPHNCLFTIKFSPKIIALTQANAPQTLLRVNGGKLWIVCKYYRLLVMRMIIPRQWLEKIQPILLKFF